MEFTYRDTRFSVAGVSENDHICSIIEQSRTFYEIDLLEYIGSLRHWLRGDTAVDVGANIGNHSLYFGKYVADRLVLFEPNPELVGLLEDNLRQSHAEWRIVPKAAGAQASRGTLVKGPDWNAGMGKAVTGEGDIVFTTLDDELQGGEVALVKIDVEGGELDVLRGATRLLTTQRPHLFVECATPTALAEIADYLAPLGYRPIVCWAATPVYHFAHRPSVALRLYAKGKRLAFKARRFISRI